MTLPVQASVAFGGGFFRVVANVLNSDFAALVFAVFATGGEAVCGRYGAQKQRGSQRDAEGAAEAGWQMCHGESLMKEWQSIAQPVLGVGNMGLRVL